MESTPPKLCARLPGASLCAARDLRLGARRQQLHGDRGGHLRRARARHRTSGVCGKTLTEDVPLAVWEISAECFKLPEIHI